MLSVQYGIGRHVNVDRLRDAIVFARLFRQAVRRRRDMARASARRRIWQRLLQPTTLTDYNSPSALPLSSRTGASTSTHDSLWFSHRTL